MSILDVNYYKIIEEAYRQHGTIIVCFDFDNTVFDYHDNGLDCSCVIELLKRCDKLGFTLICSTSDTDTKLLNFKSVFLQKKGLRVGGLLGGDVNQGDGKVNPKLTQLATHKYIKPYANIYLDDKAGLVESYSRLKSLVEKIENKRL